MRHGWLRHTTAVVVFVLAFMAFAAAAYWPWWEFAFRSDMSPVSWLSSALLVANAAVAYGLTLSGRLRRIVGVPLAIALAGLAVDEQFQVHEQLQASVTLGRFGPSIVIVIAIGGVIAAAALLKAIGAPAARRLIVAGVLVGLFAVCVDVAPPSAAIAVFEEAYEVIAESLFLCGLLEASRPHVHS